MKAAPQPDPLLKAAKEGDIDAARNIIINYQAKDFQAYWGLKAAITNNHLSVVELFLETFGEALLDVNSYHGNNGKHAAECLRLAQDKPEILARLKQESYFQGVTPAISLPRRARPGK